MRIAREQQAGAVIVAGDVFDRAVVAPDAIALYNDASVRFAWSWGYRLC